MMENSDRCSFLGLDLDNLTMDETVEKVCRIIAKRQISQHVVINAAKVVAAYYDKSLKEIINDCHLINADGQAVVFAARFLGISLKERVAGIDLMQRLINEADERKWRIFCLGASEEVNFKLIDHYKNKYPELKIAGHHGYFTAQEEIEIVRTIGSSGSDILFLALNSPQKEIFLNRYLSKLNVPFCMGVGGSFDIISGKTKRAPLWMQQSGLEWLYRIYQEPGRMWKRYAKTNPVFIYLVVKEWLSMFNSRNRKKDTGKL